MSLKPFEIALAPDPRFADLCVIVEGVARRMTFKDHHSGIADGGLKGVAPAEVQNHMISSVVAAALCIKPRGLLTDRQARKVNALKQGSQAFAIMRGLAMRFNGILRSRRSSQALDEWIDDAIDTELTTIMRFASVLRRDIDAVRNAIELPWSNGQAEGQINRLKVLR